MRYYIQYQKCDVAASVATTFIWYARSTADKVISYEKPVLFHF